ncbi:MAG: heme lyase CcmF/NrfE family subunit [Gammaproteobacteria bacterium]
MSPELGHFALILALGLALVQGIVPLAGAQRGNLAWMQVAAPAARAQFLFVLLAFAALASAFVRNDFSVLYVAANSNSALPEIYRFAAVWGAHEGSLLLWTLVLAGWTLAVTFASGTLPAAIRARVIAVMGLVSVGFLLFMLMTSNPFERLIPAAADGRDLNPLLQDPGLIVHPPLLYMGYVGTSVPFAFAIAALLHGRLDLAWARWTRPWTLVAWVFLTLGITLGSWWAYYELGWGGWWFWDPVENASFMPWLVTTALLHSLAVTEKRGAFRAWTVLLAICAFSLSLLGTFLVRSGVLVSVHAFATDPARGLFILVFLALVIGIALVLFAWRGSGVTGGGTFGLLSKESLLLVNNVLLAVAAGTVLLGTLYPLIMDTLGLPKISVGRPYFNAVFVPLMLPLLVLIGIGPLARWKRDDAGALSRRLRWAAAITFAGCAAMLAFAAVAREAAVVLAVLFALWIAATSVQGLAAHLRAAPAGRRLRALPRGLVGMTLAHLGVAVFTIGVTMATVFDLEKDVRLAPGESYAVGDYSFTFKGVTTVPGPNYIASRAEIELAQGGRKIGVLHPEKRRYTASGQVMTEAAIDPGLLRDLYVALGEPLGDGGWSLRIYHKPFVRWIWLGALAMAIGGAIGAGDRRYRAAARARQSAPPAGAEAAAA